MGNKSNYEGGECGIIIDTALSLHVMTAEIRTSIRISVGIIRKRFGHNFYESSYILSRSHPSYDSNLVERSQNSNQ
jgi:hypothetical protein